MFLSFFPTLNQILKKRTLQAQVQVPPLPLSTYVTTPEELTSLILHLINSKMSTVRAKNNISKATSTVGGT